MSNVLIIFFGLMMLIALLKFLLPNKKEEDVF